MKPEHWQKAKVCYRCYHIEDCDCCECFCAYTPVHFHVKKCSLHEFSMPEDVSEQNCCEDWRQQE